MSHRNEDIRDDGDDLIAEVRAVRQRISERTGHDPRKLVAYYAELQKAHADRLIHAPERVSRPAA